MINNIDSKLKQYLNNKPLYNGDFEIITILKSEVNKYIIISYVDKVKGYLVLTYDENNDSLMNDFFFEYLDVAEDFAESQLHEINQTQTLSKLKNLFI